MKELDSQLPLRERLFQPVDTAIMVLVRVGIGIAIYFWACSYTKVVGYDDIFLPLYDPVFMKPRFLFKYAGFEWVKLWPGQGIYWHFVVTKIAAIFLVFGFLTRVSAGIMCASIAYVLLVERQIFLNHYYLLSCAAGLLVFLPAGRRWSIDSLVGIERMSVSMPTWQFWLVRFQLGIPYVFGAIAKLNHDWLAGQPGGIFLENKAGQPLVAAYLNVHNAGLLFSYGGLFYDLLIVPMLLYRRTRWIAVLMSLGFHCTNSFLFHIGVFPWFMLATLIVFFPVDTFPNLVKFFSSKYTDDPLTLAQAEQRVASNRHARFELAKEMQSTWVAKTGFAIAATYVLIQLLLPVRPWVLPGDPSWNERGQRFAWRMMLRHKVCLTTFRVESPSGEYLFFPSSIVLTHYQTTRSERNPELLRQAAVKLKKLTAETTGIENAKIYCLALVSLNGRRASPMVDPTVDLTTVKRGWFHDPWVIQDTEPLPDEPWEYRNRPDDWWQQIELPEPFKQLQGRRPSELQQAVEAQKRKLETQ